MMSARRVRWFTLPCSLMSATGWCQENPYTYVKMSLTVPWTLYFVFLACVCIPFVLMIVLAWCKPPDDESQDTSGTR